jgi:hypothetical protein
MVKAVPLSLAYASGGFAATKSAYLSALAQDKTDDKGKVRSKKNCVAK